MVARCVAVVASALMIAGTIWLTRIDIKTVQDTSTMLTAVLGGGLFGLFMLGMLTTTGNGRAAACGIVCTLAFITWTLLAKNELLPESLSVPFDLYYTSVVGNLVMFFVGYVFGLLIFPNTKKLVNLTIWTHKDEPQDEPTIATSDG